MQFTQQVHSAILTRGRSPNWSQAWYCNIYSCLECAGDIQFEVGSKILKTFEPDIAYHITFPGDWYKVLTPVLRLCKPYVGMCILKTCIGGWTTRTRMHERNIRSCLPGCNDCSDNINYYIQCSSLLQIASQALEVSHPFSFSKRLCLDSPSPGNAQLLSLVFSLYHSAHNMLKSDDVSPMPRAVPRNLVEAAKALRQHIL